MLNCSNGNFNEFQIALTSGAPDLEFSNPAGTGFTGFGQNR
jgi:hypothetical protein